MNITCIVRNASHGITNNKAYFVVLVVVEQNIKEKRIALLTQSFDNDRGLLNV